MRKYTKKLLYLVVVTWVSIAAAGSYDDFFAALRQDDPKTIAQLLQRGFDPNTPSPQGLDGLYLALRDGSLKAAQVLVDWPKTDIEKRTPQDESPLMMASLRGHTEMARRLIARGADVNKPGWTPLHYAATNGHLGVIELLLDEHAYIDAESPNGTTPLMMAAHYGSSQAVKLLLDSGADPTLRNQLGLSALDFAQRGNRKDAAQLLSEVLKSKQPPGKW